MIIDLATGGVVGGLRAKRETYADTEVNNVLPIQQCHPLGNDTSLSTKWLIGAITAGLYLIVIVSTVVYTSVAIKVEKRLAFTSRLLVPFTPQYTHVTIEWTFNVIFYLVRNSRKKGTITVYITTHQRRVPTMHQ